MSHQKLNTKIVKTRREFVDILSSRISSTYDAIKEEGKQKPKQNLLKSYMVEINKVPFLGIRNYLKNYKINVAIKETDDPRLINLIFFDNNEEYVFYVDKSIHERFLVIHTLEPADASDKIIRKIVHNVGSKFDYLWFPTQMLEKFTDMFQGYLSGLGVQYKYGRIFGDDEILIDEMLPQKRSIQKKKVNDLKVTYFTMRLWGEFTPKLLNIFKRNPDLTQFFSLSSIQIKRLFDEENLHDPEEAQFVIENIYYWAKVIAKGPSITAHFETLDDLQKEYKCVLTQIEDNLIGVSQTEKYHILEGAPFIINLKNPIQDIEEFVKAVFTGRPPFRIWAVESEVKDENAYVVFGTDFHNGDQIELEITPDWIRIYLERGACGNTILRFLTNLQRYYDPNATLESEEYGRII